MLMSYGTGSVGLNLQFTNYVFLFDRWWNPAIEDQAINRAHRLGQKDTVFVTRFITQDTIEGRIAEVLEKKRQLFNELIEPERAAAGTGADGRRHFSVYYCKMCGRGAMRRELAISACGVARSNSRYAASGRTLRRKRGRQGYPSLRPFPDRSAGGMASAQRAALCSR